MLATPRCCNDLLSVNTLRRGNHDRVNVGTFNRVVRWFSNDAVERTEGAEFEAVWTPIRNYQAVISGSWIWTADTLADPSVIRVNPNGSINNIAGIVNREGNVLGMMPHPERSVESRLGSADGLAIFKSLVLAATAVSVLQT